MNHTMEWSKDKTIKLIELLQVEPALWNPTLCYTRRDKQKRKEALRSIADNLEVYVADVTKKLQHLRTQYNRESAQEARSNIENPGERYVSTWYAYDYLHFLKDTNKPYGILQSNEDAEDNDLNTSDNLEDCKSIPPHKISRRDSSKSIKHETHTEFAGAKDDLLIFGQYIANELRSVKGEKNLLIAKKKILDVIFEVKMSSTCDERTESTVCGVFSHGSRQSTNSIHSDKVFTTPTISSAQIEPLSVTHTTPTSGISEIIINSACHYS